MEKSKLRNEALDALHKGIIDGQFPENPELREELWKIRRWWSRACDAVNYERQDPILQDEASYAVEWCIRLAEQIVEDQRTLARGAKPGFSFTRQWVWECFENLEAGLRSNGTNRPG